MTHRYRPILAAVVFASSTLHGFSQVLDKPTLCGFWSLERATADLYEDADAAQIGSPDPGIALSTGVCP